MLQIGDFVRVKGSEGSAWEIARRCAMKDAVKKAQKTIAYESYNYNPGEDNPFYEDVGIKPAQVGWWELQLIADILTSVENADDVKQVADAILHPEKYLD